MSFNTIGTKSNMSGQLNILTDTDKTKEQIIAERDTLQRIKNALEINISSISKQNDISINNNIDLKRQREQLIRENTALKISCGNSSSILSQTNDVDTLNIKINELNTKLNLQDTEIQGLREDRDDWKKKWDLAVDSNNHLLQTSSKLIADLNYYKSEVEKCNAGIHESESILKDRIEQLENEKASLSNEKDQLIGIGDNLIKNIELFSLQPHLINIGKEFKLDYLESNSLSQQSTFEGAYKFYIESISNPRNKFVCVGMKGKFFISKINDNNQLNTVFKLSYGENEFQKFVPHAVHAYQPLADVHTSESGLHKQFGQHAIRMPSLLNPKIEIDDTAHSPELQYIITQIKDTYRL